MDYETRRQNRIARLNRSAEKLSAEGAARFESGRKALELIPFGQPILVGHHSERRDRNYRANADGKMRAGFELMKAGEDAARRAAAAEENTAISSDDPEALTKLRAKLAELEAEQERDKAVNKIVLPELRRGPEGAWEARAIARLVEAGLCASEGEAKVYTVKDFAGRYGVPNYRITNRNAEIRRVAKRIQELEKKAARPEQPAERYGEIEVSEDRGWNRVQIRFPDKPAPEVRAELKAYGFRWAPSADAWQRQASNNAWYFARQVARAASGVQEPVLVQPETPTHDVEPAPAAEEV